MSAHTPTTRTRAAVACAALLVTGCRAPTRRDTARPRNVILMMADDLASNDLPCYGGRKFFRECAVHGLKGRDAAFSGQELRARFSK